MFVVDPLSQKVKILGLAIVLFASNWKESLYQRKWRIWRGS